jgi:hypothetical protein
VLPIISPVTPGAHLRASDLAAVDSRQCALDVALAASKSGLCRHVCWHLDNVYNSLVCAVARGVVYTVYRLVYPYCSKSHRCLALY